MSNNSGIYTLAYKNTNPNRVKPKKDKEDKPKKAKRQKTTPIFIRMEHHNLYETSDDTE